MATSLTKGLKAQTPMAFVRAILAAYQRYGLSPDLALRAAGIAPELTLIPDARITASQFENLTKTAMQELDDEALGWFSRRLPWGSHGLLCRGSLGAPHLGMALTRWCRHHRLLTQDITLSLSVKADTATLAIEPHIELGALQEFCLVSTLRYVHSYACWWIDSRMALSSVNFPFAAPPHQQVYPLLFPGPAQFGSKHAGFSFDAHYLSQTPRRDEKALQLMLRRALQLPVLQYRRDRLFVRRVSEVIRNTLGEPLHADALAQALNVSVRTLHRHLSDEGSSLQALKDEARREQAMALLQRGQKSVKQVATLCGFDSEKSFSRAFKLWTGRTPSDFRRS